MKRSVFFFLVSLITFFGVWASGVFAEESSQSGTARANIQELHKENQDLLASRAAQLKAERENAQKNREQIAAQFKENLQKIRDTRKKEIVSNVSDRIANRNSLWVTHWNEVTKRLSAILDKIQTRSDEAAKQGKDVTAITSAITSARSAIAAAQAAIDAQSLKTYSITITTDDTLGTNVRQTIEAFQTDVKNVISLLNVARASVQNVFQAIRTVVGTTTPSPTPEP